MRKDHKLEEFKQDKNKYKSRNNTNWFKQGVIAWVVTVLVFTIIVIEILT